jgi:alcohol dehydrogenase class IV
MDFNYYIPTRIVSGRGCVKQNAELLSKIGKKAFLMTGPSSAQKNGSLEDMKQALDSQGIAYQHYNKVKPNPSLQDVREASQVAKEAGADFVIAIGGGSPMDAAKAVAVLTACDVSDEDLLALREFPAVLPLVTIPTTSGTGSEVTPYSILTNDSLETKSFLNSHQIYPVLSFLDARYTIALPKSITNATAVDALSHSVEGFLAVRSTAMSRVFALESLRLLGKLLSKLGTEEALSLEDREGLLFASALAGFVIAQSGTTAVHAMGYSLTYFKGIDHGVANGMLMGAYLKFIQKSRPEDIDAILGALGYESIDTLSQLIADLVGAEPLPEEEILKFSGIAINAGNIQNTTPKPSQAELAEMYRLSSGK